MPQYKVLAKSFINNSIVEEGEIVEYDGKPGSNLELIDDDKPKSKAKAKRGDVAAAVFEEEGGE